jgi:hypothetical protein
MSVPLELNAKNVESPPIWATLTSRFRLGPERGLYKQFGCTLMAAARISFD